VPLTDEEEATLAALQQETDDIETASAEAEELTDEQDRRMGEIETAIEAITARPVRFEADEVARAGAFVSIAPDGSLRIDRGYVRPEDELPIEPEPEEEIGSGASPANASPMEAEHDGVAVYAGPGEPIEPEEEDGIKPLSDRLLTELTAHRTLSLRHALGERPDVAFLAALHALALSVFYTYRSDTCLELDVKSVQFGSQAPGLNDTALARAFDERHQSWRASLPKESGELWDVLQGWDGDSRHALFAHCVAQGVNAVHEAWNRRPRALAHADRLAQAVDLDMAAEGWTPTVDGYLGRVTKARILQAVAEGRGQRDADRIEHLKKGEMAEQAQVMLTGSGWLPEPLRTPGRALPVVVEVIEPEPDVADTTTVEETAVDGGEPAMADDEQPAEDEEVAFEPHAIAAE